MNLYLRYFSEETLVHSVDEAVNFLTSLSDFRVDENMINDLRQFAESSVSYPKRYKIRPRVYFIVIKTTANTMEEFKANNKKNATATDSTNEAAAPHKNDKQAELAEEKKGWYEGSIMFKRVIPIQGTGKFQYRDTLFVARCKANSAIHCYERIVQHLRNRQDVDLRSSFLRPKGKTFTTKTSANNFPHNQGNSHNKKSGSYD